MKVALICFSLTGQQTGERLCRGLEAAGLTAELDKKSKYLLDSIQISTSAWAGEKFSDSDALIFIGATSILLIFYICFSSGVFEKSFSQIVT